MTLNRKIAAGYTPEKMKFSIKDSFSKCNQIRNFLRIWSHLLKKSFMGNFIFSAVVARVSVSKNCDIARKKRCS